MPGEVEIGDVFSVNGGRGKGSRWQVIVGMTETHAFLLVFRGNGEICGVQYYGLHYLETRTVVGRVEGLDEISLNVNWFGSQ